MNATQLRDRATGLAREDPEAALRMARNIADPWFRAQALAAVARWSHDGQVARLAAESLASAAACRDDYRRAAVAAWPIRALVERGHHATAIEALGVARQRALAAVPAASRAEALFGLLQAAWPLGAPARRSLVEDLAATHELDNFWRVSRCLVDALVMMRADDPDVAMQIATRISDSRCRSKAVQALERREPCAARDYFGA